MKADLAAIRTFLDFVHQEYATVGNPDQKLYHAARAAHANLEKAAGCGPLEKKAYDAIKDTH